MQAAGLRLIKKSQSHEKTLIDPFAFCIRIIDELL